MLHICLCERLYNPPHISIKTQISSPNLEQSGYLLITQEDLQCNYFRKYIPVISHPFVDQKVLYGQSSCSPPRPKYEGANLFKLSWIYCWVDMHRSPCLFNQPLIFSTKHYLHLSTLCFQHISCKLYGMQQGGQISCITNLLEGAQVWDPLCKGGCKMVAYRVESVTITVTRSTWDFPWHSN